MSIVVAKAVLNEGGHETSHLAKPLALISESTTPIAIRRPRHLPAEIIDLILDNLYFCPLHRWSSHKTPCANWHDGQLPSLLPLRLVCRHFSERITPSVFHHITCKGSKRHQTLKDLSRHNLAAHVRVLRLEVAPSDFGSRMRRVNNAFVPVDKKLLHYFEVLPIFLVPFLKRFEAVRTLHITTTYSGILDKNIPKNDAMDPCLAALCKSVRQAQMADLEELAFGVPYLGGYTHFFEDIDEHKHGNMLKSCARSLRTASVKLFDNQGNFTTMPFF